MLTHSSSLNNNVRFQQHRVRVDFPICIINLTKKKNNQHGHGGNYDKNLAGVVQSTPC